MYESSYHQSVLLLTSQVKRDVKLGDKEAWPMLPLVAIILLSWSQAPNFISIPAILAHESAALATYSLNNQHLWKRCLYNINIYLKVVRILKIFWFLVVLCITQHFYGLSMVICQRTAHLLANSGSALMDSMHIYVISLSIYIYYACIIYIIYIFIHICFR